MKAVISSVVGAVVFYVVLQQLWPAPAGVLVQGVIVGALTAMISLGIALVYRSSRAINFAQADLGTVPVALAVSLMAFHQLSFWLAFPLVIVLSGGLGWGVERLILRRFTKAPRLIVTVVTIGVAQVLVGVASAIPFLIGGSLPSSTYKPPFHFSFEISPVVFHANDLVGLVVVILSVLGLAALLRYTSIGIAIRAAAESADRAALLGINVARLQSYVWVIAAVLAGTATMLRAGILGVPLGAAFGPELMLRALAAAVIGRMERFVTMFVAAVALGVIEVSILWDKGSTALVAPVTFVVIIGALLLQRRGAESRVADQAISSWADAQPVRPIPVELANLPEVRWGRWTLGAIGVGALVALPLFLTAGRTNLAAAMLIYAILAVSLVVLVGWSGEISLGQVGFLGIGAAVSGALNTHWHWDLTISVLAAALVGALVAVVVGLPALKIRGTFLAVTSLAFAVLTSSFLLNRTYFGYIPDQFKNPVRRFPLLGRVDITSERAMYYVCLGGLGLSLWLVAGLRGRVERVLIALRDNERAAQGFGLSPVRVKLMAFSISGFLASLAGGLLAIHQRAVGAQLFQPVESLRALTMVVVGGLGSVPGALIGTIFVKATEWFDFLVPADYRFLFQFVGSGVGLIGVLMIVPTGLGSLFYQARDVALRAIANRRGIHVDGLTDRKNGIESDGADVDKAVAASAVTPGADVLLEVRELDVFYGKVQVLFGAHLRVERGEVLALLGTNGAGKSTVLRAICGLASARAGVIELEGDNITNLPAHRIASLGIAQVPGGKAIFPSLTVEEHLRLAAWTRDDEEVGDSVDEVRTMFPILEDKAHSAAATLSGGQQQMLGLAMAFIARPKLLIIDELSLGLAPVIVEQLLGTVRKFRDLGTTVILVEQSVNVALTVADRAYFLEKGEVRFEGPTAALLKRPDMLRSVFLQGAAAGRDTNGQAQRRRVPAKPKIAASTVPSLEVVGLSKAFAGIQAVQDVAFSLGEREVVGIIGPNGAGKTTVFDLISGFLAPTQGALLLRGVDVTSRSPHQRAELGLARSFQDARLFASLTVRQAIAVGLDTRIATRDPIAAALHLPEVMDGEFEIAERVEELIELFALGAYRNKLLGELSTGSRRVVDLACQMGVDPKVILFDEPSSGIAQREAEQLGPLLLRIRDETGASLLVIEHDMPLIRTVSDRLIALDLGCKIAEGKPDEVLANPLVVASYLGGTEAAIERSGSPVRIKASR